MNATQNQTAAEVIMQAVYEMSDDYLDVITVDMIAEGNDRNTLTWTTDHILSALDEAGYTIAGPGQVVVDRGRWERVKNTAEITTYMKFRGDDSETYTACEAMPLGLDCLKPGDLDPLPTQEGE